MRIIRWRTAGSPLDKRFFRPWVISGASDGMALVSILEIRSRVKRMFPWTKFWLAA